MAARITETGRKRTLDALEQEETVMHRVAALDRNTHEGIIHGLKDELRRSRDWQTRVNMRNTDKLAVRAVSVHDTTGALVASAAKRARLEAVADAILAQPDTGTIVSAPAPAVVAEQTECVVCMEPIRQRVAFAPCGHTYVCTTWTNVSKNRSHCAGRMCCSWYRCLVVAYE